MSHPPFSGPLAWLLLIITACLNQAHAQPSLATLDGQVVDPSGAAIAGARVSATSRNRASASTQTGQTGEFSLPLVLGVYALKVEADGFLEEVRSITVTGSRPEPIAIQLHLPGQ